MGTLLPTIGLECQIAKSSRWVRADIASDTASTESRTLLDRVWSPARRKGFAARISTLRLLPHVAPGLSLAMAVTTLLSGLLPVAFTLASGRLVGALPGVVRIGLDSSEGARMLTMLATVASLFALQQTLNPIQSAIVSAFGLRLDGYLQARTMRALAGTAGIAHLEDPTLLDQVAVARGVGPGGWSPGSSIGPMSAVAAGYIQGILAGVVLARFDWMLSAFLLAVLLVARQRWRRELIRLVKTMTGQAQALRHSDYFRELILAPSAAKETRIFGLSGWISDRFSQHWQTAMEEIWRERRRGTLAALAALAFNWLPFSLVFFALARAGAGGRIGTEEIAVYALAVFNARVLSFVGPNDLQLEYGMASVPAAIGLEETTEISRLTHSGRHPTGLPVTEIRFESVEFRYPNTERDIYNGLDLLIPAGRSLAIVGANGAGKSTLIKLLCRFYDPTAGRITADGIDIREFEPSEWQRRLAAIFQDFVRYKLSARANVGFGALERSNDDEALAVAIRRAGAEEIFNDLPQGWDTILSRQFTDGVDLSGGQWQRIALARAMLAAGNGTGLLVLDEPTANLDARAEAEIYERFLDLTRGLTTIVISHRFSTVRKADRICVLHEGQVVEEGTHDELIILNGRYAQMFNLQASRFSDEAEATE